MKRFRLIFFSVLLCLFMGFSAYSYWTEQLKMKAELKVTYPLPIEIEEQ